MIHGVVVVEHKGAVLGAGDGTVNYQCVPVAGPEASPRDIDVTGVGVGDGIAVPRLDASHCKFAHDDVADIGNDVIAVCPHADALIVKFNATAVGHCAAIIKGGNTAAGSNTAAFSNDNGIAASSTRTQADAFGSGVINSDIGGLNCGGRTGQQQGRGAD